jgi:hypothetical protein
MTPSAQHFLILVDIWGFMASEAVQIWLLEKPSTSSLPLTVPFSLTCSPKSAPKQAQIEHSPFRFSIYSEIDQRSHKLVQDGLGVSKSADACLK